MIKFDYDAVINTDHPYNSAAPSVTKYNLLLVRLVISFLVLQS